MKGQRSPLFPAKRRTRRLTYKNTGLDDKTSFDYAWIYSRLLTMLRACGKRAILAVHIASVLPRRRAGEREGEQAFNYATSMWEKSNFSRTHCLRTTTKEGGRERGRTGAIRIYKLFRVAYYFTAYSCLGWNSSTLTEGAS